MDEKVTVITVMLSVPYIASFKGIVSMLNTHYNYLFEFSWDYPLYPVKVCTYKCIVKMLNGMLLFCYSLYPALLTILITVVHARKTA